MTTNTAETAERSLSDEFAANVRGHLGRRGASVRGLASQLHMSEAALGRRLHPGRTVDITLEEAALIAAGLGLPLADLLP